MWYRLLLDPDANVGSELIRIGFWEVFYTITIIRNPQNSIGNYLGPHIRSFFSGFRRGPLEGLRARLRVLPKPSHTEPSNAKP